MEQAIGGSFEAVGLIERDLLVWLGLQPSDNVVDVGCGAGRLAEPLARIHQGPYLGTDVVPALLDHARGLARRADWRFELVDDSLSIPAPNESADWVCFFSVLTHLKHEASYLYLKEAKRVLRPEGRIVMSFLEFAIPSHWSPFEQSVTDIAAGNEHPLNQFIDRGAIEAWSTHLDFRVLQILDGDQQNIPLSQPVTTESGQQFADYASLGQSVAVLGHRAAGI
jgi:ubiquinone/menaquinone biosynthesis C-methylase UbiE